MRILIAGENKGATELLACMIESFHHEIVGIVTSGGLDVIAAYDRFLPDAVVTDIVMPKINGLTVCHVLMSRNPAPKVVFVSGYYTADHPFIQRSGASAILGRPATMAQISAVLQYLEAPLELAHAA